MKKILSFLLALALCAGLGVPALAAGFSDVPPGHYAAEAIESCVAKGVASGYADGTFRPDQPVTNAQFAVMMARAFFPEDLAEFQTQTEGKPWYWAACETLAKYNSAGYLREKTRWTESAGQSLTRYKLAFTVYCVLNATIGKRGHVVEVEDREAAQAQIADFDSIPSTYQISVGTVCALGIMSGYPDGTFGGEKVVNRGQVCAVIERMAGEITGGSVTVQFPAVVTDPASTSVAVGSTYYGDIGWSIVNNQYPNGTLNNGKPITEENVLAMLADAKTNWAPGMNWGIKDAGKGSNRYTPDRGSSAQSAIRTECMRNVSEISGTHIVRINVSQGTTGFAAMLSDYMFGPGSNYPRTLEDPLQVRPGDIIIQRRIQKNGPYITDVAIAISGVEYSAQGTPMVRICAGGHNDQVVWDDDPGLHPYTRLDSYMGGKDNSMKYETVVLTRYPA